jgi:hypothetical protein
MLAMTRQGVEIAAMKKRDRRHYPTLLMSYIVNQMQMESPMRTLVTVLIFIFASQAAMARTPAPEGAEVYFITQENGATVTSPVTVRFGLRNMGVAPAGIQMDNTGHHHLLVNTDLPVLDRPIPADDNHRHYGLGQTEVKLELPPGEHTLQLLLGDYAHIPHDPPVKSERITITVD